MYKNPRNLPSALCPRDEEQAALLVRTASENTVRGFGYCVLCFSDLIEKRAEGRSKKTKATEVKVKFALEQAMRVQKGGAEI